MILKPTITSAPIKKLLEMFRDRPAINKPITIMLDVCPIPQCPYQKRINGQIQQA